MFNQKNAEIKSFIKVRPLSGEFQKILFLVLTYMIWDTDMYTKYRYVYQVNLLKE